MRFRYDSAEELADESALRALERIAGLGAERQVARDGELEIAVFNPSPHPRTDRVRLPLAGFPAFTSAGIDPLLLANAGAEGFHIGGRPARLVAASTEARPRLAPDQPVYDLEFVAEEVPAFGWKRMPLRKAAAAREQVDEGRRIASDEVEVEVEEGGTFSVRIGELRARGLAAFEDLGDRGDSYDFDAVAADAVAADTGAADTVGAGASSPPVEALETRRWRHPNGCRAWRCAGCCACPRRSSQGGKREAPRASRFRSSSRPGSRRGFAASTCASRWRTRLETTGCA